jgi:phosphatidylethanolamine/phosphatidyl-N-methylethanolamine N-methyltransferase
MTEPATGRLYDAWSDAYDHTFGRLVVKRQGIAIDQLRLKPGDRVLDLGVGTGTSLPQYPGFVDVVGVDLSLGMLQKADQKIRTMGLDHCRLVQGDAMLPPLARQSFDHVVVTHTVSVVSEPARLMEWVAQLVKPGGKIVVLNHFRSSIPLVSFFERTLSPVFVKLGWRSDLALEDCFDPDRLTLHYAFKLSWIDVWQIAVFSRPTDEHFEPVRDHPAAARIHRVKPRSAPSPV